MLRRQFWLVALVVFVGIAAAAFVTSRQQPVYRASAKAVIGEGPSVFVPEVGTVTQPAAQTMRNLLESNIVARRVIQRLGLETTPRKLLSNLNVTFAPDSAVLDLTYDSPSKQQAVATLNAITIEFAGLIDRTFGTTRQTTTPPAQQVQPLTIRIFDEAHLEAGRVSPHPKRTMAFAGLLALVIGVLLALARERLSNAVRTEEDAEQAFGAPVVGVLPKEIRSTAAVTNGRVQDRRVLDAVQLLAVNLEHVQGRRVIVLTSAEPEPAKSTVAAHLATHLAQAGDDVLCVEANLRNPELHRYLPLDPARPGIAELLAGGVALDDIVQEIDAVASSEESSIVLAPNARAVASWRGKGSAEAAALQPLPQHPLMGRLRALSAGKVAQEASLGTPGRVGDLFQRLRDRAAYVIVDAPAILSSADALVLASLADKVMLVATEGRTTTEAAASARLALERIDIAEPGVVLIRSL